MDSTAGRDFFISYTGVNRAWAEWIAVQLEAAGYTTLLQAFDFRPGRDFVQLMQEATTTAERTIAVLSPAYFGSTFGAAEWRAAFVKDPTGELGLLVPVRVQPCDPPGLLASRVYVDLVDADEATCRRLLLDAVDKDWTRPTTVPFPGAASSTTPQPTRFPGLGPAISNLPARNPNFTGRDGLLDDIHEALRKGSAAAVVPTEAVHGLGGIGKTRAGVGVRAPGSAATTTSPGGYRPRSPPRRRQRWPGWRSGWVFRRPRTGRRWSPGCSTCSAAGAGGCWSMTTRSDPSTCPACCRPAAVGRCW